MLKAICQYLVDHNKDTVDEDIKDFVANVVANLYANSKTNVR